MQKTKLKPLNTLLILLIFSQTHLKISNGFSLVGSDSLKTTVYDPMVKRVSPKTVGQCIPSEIGSEGDTKRRTLMVQKRYISYETLKRDLVPCKKPGASYYNCRPAGEANPYSRGCEFITGCARDISEVNP